MRGGEVVAQQQLEKIYRLYASELTTYAKILTKNQQDAEALVSDAFFQLAIQETYPPEIKYWLFRVVKNRFIDGERKKARWWWQPLEKTILKSKATPEEELFQTEEHRELYRGIQKLTTPYAEVITFFYFMDWSINQISQFMEMTPGQVRTILYRGRKKLKEVIQDERLA